MLMPKSRNDGSVDNVSAIQSGDLGAKKGKCKQNVRFLAETV